MSSLARVTSATTPDVAGLAASLKALADPTRLRLLGLLADGERCVCELYEPLGIAQNLASHHLRVLREAGLVTARRDSRWAYYSLERDPLEAALGELDALLAGHPGADPPARCG